MADLNINPIQINITQSLDYVWRKIKDIINADKEKSAGTISFTVKIAHTDLNMAFFKNLSTTLDKANIEAVKQVFYLEIVKKYTGASSETNTGDIIFTGSLLMRYEYNVVYSNVSPSKRVLYSSFVRLENSKKDFIIRRSNDLLYQSEILQVLRNFFSDYIYQIESNPENIVFVEFAIDDELFKGLEYVQFTSAKDFDARAYKNAKAKMEKEEKKRIAAVSNGKAVVTDKPKTSRKSSTTKKKESVTKEETTEKKKPSTISRKRSIKKKKEDSEEVSPPEMTIDGINYSVSFE